MNENDILAILNDDKNYKEVRIPTEERLEIFKELDHRLVAAAIMDKIKEDEHLIQRRLRNDAVKNLNNQNDYNY